MPHMPHMQRHKPRVQARPRLWQHRPARQEQQSQPPTTKRRQSFSSAAYVGRFCTGVVTVLPCLHNFCGACLTAWQNKGNVECPSCRGPCTDVRRNHQFRTVIEEFLSRHPSRRRTAEEIADMDKKDKFTNENLRVQAVRRPHDYYSEEEDSSSGSSLEDEDGACHECDGSADPAPPDGFSCGVGAPGGHTMCYACNEYMPNRSADPTCDRPQKCLGCNRAMCNLYYAYKGGCRVNPLPERMRLRKLGDDTKTEIPPSNPTFSIWSILGSRNVDCGLEPIV
eukprot:m.72310 g.72310  ORF g.72310 m.72310 type:complete len:281 (-) comp10104_c0_seq2:373-1215(-)